MMIVGKRNTSLFRFRTLIAGLQIEVNTGIQLTRGRSASAILKKELDLPKGMKKAIVLFHAINAYNALVEQYQRDDAANDENAMEG